MDIGLSCRFSMSSQRTFTSIERGLLDLTPNSLLESVGRQHFSSAPLLTGNCSFLLCLCLPSYMAITRSMTRAENTGKVDQLQASFIARGTVPGHCHWEWGYRQTLGVGPYGRPSTGLPKPTSICIVGPGGPLLKLYTRVE